MEPGGDDDDAATGGADSEIESWLRDVAHTPTSGGGALRAASPHEAINGSVSTSATMSVTFTVRGCPGAAAGPATTACDATGTSADDVVSPAMPEQRSCA